MSRRPATHPKRAGRRWSGSSLSRPCPRTSSGRTPMRKIWDAHQMEHAPVVELHNGAFVPHAEHPGRAESILAAIGGTEPARDHGEAPILRVHRRGYVDFVKRAHADWMRSEEHTSGLQSLMPLSNAVFC